MHSTRKWHAMEANKGGDALIIANDYYYFYYYHFNYCAGVNYCVRVETESVQVEHRREQH